MTDPDVPEHAVTASYADPASARLTDEIAKADRAVARLTEVVERCERAVRLLLTGAAANRSSDVAARLTAKAEGVELALSYVHDALSVARVHVAAAVDALNAERVSG